MSRGSPKVDPGDLIHQVAILHPVASSDLSGSTETMEPLLTTFAKIDVVRGIEVIRSGQTTTQLFVTITIWFDARVLASMQVQGVDGRYVIQSIEDPQMGNVLMVLNCVGINE